MLHWLEAPGIGVAATKAAMVATKKTTLENIFEEMLMNVGLKESVGIVS